MRLGTWKARSLYKPGSFTAVAREWASCKLDLVDVQEVRWDKEDTVRTGDYNFSRENNVISSNWEQDFLYTTE
jgi:hypothetical protein